MKHTGSMNRGRRLVGLGAALIASVALSGCSASSYDVCPTIGWANTLTVTLDGAIADVTEVQMCVDEQCSIPAPSKPATDEPVPVETLSPQDREAYTPNPSVVASPYFASQIDDDSWEFSLTMMSPKNVTLRALSASGDVLAAQDVTLDWVRVGGSEQCGGPAEARPVTLTIAS